MHARVCTHLPPHPRSCTFIAQLLLCSVLYCTAFLLLLYHHPPPTHTHTRTHLGPASTPFRYPSPSHQDQSRSVRRSNVTASWMCSQRSVSYVCCDDDGCWRMYASCWDKQTQMHTAFCVRIYTPYTNLDTHPHTPVPYTHLTLPTNKNS